ncbi:hypothetical protein P4200_01540 [Pseudomonas aeruginosa]|nr:hypothetical protein [Pseudomonas aeruginosa]
MAYWFIHLANSYRANDVMKAIALEVRQQFLPPVITVLLLWITTLTGMWG